MSSTGKCQCCGSANGQEVFWGTFRCGPCRAHCPPAGPHQVPRAAAPDLYEIAQQLVERFCTESPSAHPALRVGFIEGVNQMMRAAQQANR